MKKILITGKNSYIGTSIEKWLAKSPDKYEVESISVRGNYWRTIDFSLYDVVFHVAGIAHVSTNPRKEYEYFKVNKELTIDIATKAKNDGVSQFIFMSSIIVYGTQNEFIDKNTEPNPDNFYGASKLAAEKGILPLETESFKVVIVRPPMIYGKDSKGNYPKLAKLARITPVFPDFNNRRSMLHIDNLSEFIKIMIDYEESGIFFPQNKEQVQTSYLVKLISKRYNRKIYFTEIFNPLIKMLANLNVINKMFGNLIYDFEISIYKKKSYHIRSLRESIEWTENKLK